MARLRRTKPLPVVPLCRMCFKYLGIAVGYLQAGGHFPGNKKARQKTGGPEKSSKRFLETERSAEPDRAIASIRTRLQEAVAQAVVAKASPLLPKSGILNEGIHAAEDGVVEGIQYAHTELEGRALRNFEVLRHTDIGNVLNRVRYRVTRRIAKRRTKHL